ncbi:helix-turn-helix domain-containing protein [Chondrinema litorale]|uniref:helix-turn-helix domain-containing protein n=1 Tax=Chondrinema litorale TaxID=2994555 RepID=UPI0025432375|nr:AraC family transcriptional regulator [Chondrinema litorale]UZR94417.1 AraC family transcriptional regulator [Chondrinema litorale]
MESNSKYHQLPILDGLELLDAKSHILDFPFHTHETFNIALILISTFNTKLSDKFLKAPVGTLSITNPKEVHATPCDKDLGNSFFTYYVSPEAIKTFNNGVEVFFEDKIIYDQQLFGEFYALSKNITHTNFEKRLSQVLKVLVEKYTSPMRFNFQTRNLFQEFINETTFEKFSLSKTAHQFGISKFKFLRLFKNETGLTPNHYILLKRIEKSKKMLKEGKPVFDVAIDCNFYDKSHFYKNFKRFTGVNPSEYQNAALLS